MEIKIKLLNEAEIQKKLSLIPKKAPSIVSRVINRVISNINKNISKEVKSRYIIKTSDIKKTLKTHRASGANPVGKITSLGEKIALYKFKVTPSKPLPSKSAQMKGKNGRALFKAKVLKGGNYKKLRGGFVAQMKSGHTGVFSRISFGRLPLKEFMGPSVPEMIGKQEVITRIEEDANKMLEKRLIHELDRALN